MSSKQNASSPAWLKYYAYGIFPCVVVVLCFLKVFLLPDCWGFDANDEGTHTFPNLFAAFNLMREGAMPWINLRHNFGMPLIGDCLTFPFSPLTLTYHILSPPHASTFNRALIIFMTLISLTYYYRRYLSLFTSSVCAFMVVFTPGVIWNMAHHHYQSTVFYVSVLLILQDRIFERVTRRRLFLFYLTVVFFTLSVNSNLLAFAFSFVCLNGLFSPQGVRFRYGILAALLILIAMIVSVPEFHALITQIPLSTRTGELYGVQMPLREFLLSLVGGAKLTFNNQYLHYISWPLIFSLGCGIFLLLKTEKNKVLVWRTVFLGLIPLLFVAFLLGNRAVYWAIPFIKSTDVTRILWVSNIFVMIALGKFWDDLNSDKIALRVLCVFFLIYLGFVLVFQFLVGWQHVAWQYRSGVFAFQLLLMLYIAASQLDVSETNKRLMTGGMLFLLSVGLMFSRMPIFDVVFGYRDMQQCRIDHSHWFSPASMKPYPYQPFLKHLEPDTRITHEAGTYLGLDSRIQFNQMFTAQGKSTLLHARLFEYVIGTKLATRYEHLINYHFIRPWQTELLSDLGIKYFVQIGMDPDTARRQLPVLAKFGPIHLIENPVPTGMAYLQSEREKVILEKDRIHFLPNSVSIDLPGLKEPADLVLTFIHRPAWRVYIDGNEAELFHHDNQMLRVKVSAADQKVLFKYEPFTIAQVVGFAVLSAGLLTLLLFIVGRMRLFRGNPPK